MHGRVAAFDDRRGLGEIETETGERYPFHCTQLINGSRSIGVGTEVEFERTPGLQGRWEGARVAPTD